MTGANVVIWIIYSLIPDHRISFVLYKLCRMSLPRSAPAHGNYPWSRVGLNHLNGINSSLENKKEINLLRLKTKDIVNMCKYVCVLLNNARFKDLKIT